MPNSASPRMPRSRRSRLCFDGLPRLKPSDRPLAGGLFNCRPIRQGRRAEDRDEHFEGLSASDGPTKTGRPSAGGRGRGARSVLWRAGPASGRRLWPGGPARSDHGSGLCRPEQPLGATLVGSGGQYGFGGCGPCLCGGDAKRTLGRATGRGLGDCGDDAGPRLASAGRCRGISCRHGDAGGLDGGVAGRGGWLGGAGAGRGSVEPAGRTPLPVAASGRARPARHDGCQPDRADRA